jgi:hypothetical protein
MRIMFLRPERLFSTRLMNVQRHRQLAMIKEHKVQMSWVESIFWSELHLRAVVLTFHPLQIGLSSRSRNASASKFFNGKMPLETCDELMRHKFKAISLFLKQVAYREPTLATMKANQVCDLATTCAISLCTEKFHPLPVKHGYVVSNLGTFVAAQIKGEQKLSDLEQLVLRTQHPSPTHVHLIPLGSHQNSSPLEP